MRQTTAFSLLPLLLLGCGFLTFDVQGSASTHVDGSGVVGVLLGALDFTGFDNFDVGIEQALQDQGVNPGDVKGAQFTDFTLTGSPGDLSFLDSFAVYLSAEGVDEAKIASGDSFPEGHLVVSLDLPDVDLTPYIEANASSFRIEASGSAPTDDVDITADFTVSVTATAQGACRELKKGGSP